MEHIVPRIVIAGSGSGCGKTSISCALMQCFVNRGMKLGAFKCGPDYIDPMFHSSITGGRSTNLDSFFFDDETVSYLLCKNGANKEINIIEGVMGYYDGLGLKSTKSSTYDIAKITNSPVILCIDSKGAALSVIAVIKGFAEFRADNNIRGVILNRCSSMSYKILAEEIEKEFAGRLRPLGYLPEMPECSLESRHLGLVTAAEVAELNKKLERLSVQAEQSIDIEGVLQLANSAASVSAADMKRKAFSEPVRIAVARDKAFCFYYEDSLDVLRELGAELVPFSPMIDSSLPKNIHGLYMGGGYPELYARALSENTAMLGSIKTALDDGLCCIAECGGFMYLTEAIGDYPMVSYIKARSYNTGRLRRFGYIKLSAKQDSMLCKAGDSISAHEFHYWDSDDNGDAFSAKKASGSCWDCVHAGPGIYAGYPHFHFLSNTDFAVNFYKACLEVKHSHV